MKIRLHSSLVAVVLGLSLAHARPVAAADLWTASQNTVSNNIEIDKFDSGGLLADGLYLHTPFGNLGSGYFSDFAFDPAGNLRVASANSVSNNVEIDRFDSTGLLTDGFYLHTAFGNLGAGYFSGLAFDPSGNLRVASANSVSNNVEIDEFDSSGLLTDGFYLHTAFGNLGAGYFSDFAFDPAGNLWVASANSVSNNVEIDEFDSTGLLTDGFYLHTAFGNLGAGYFSDFAFDASGSLWVSSANSVSNNVEIDEFDSTGLLTNGFYLHTAFGNLGAGYYSDFDFAPSAATAAPEPATWSMMAIGFGLFGAISLRKAGLKRRRA